MKPQCNTSADCLRELARVMDQFGIDDIFAALRSKYCKWSGGEILNAIAALEAVEKHPDLLTCAIAEVEGKPVFIGDELYYAGNKYRAKRASKNIKGVVDAIETEDRNIIFLDNLSWNPPKPATVMVELTVEDAEYVTGKRQYSISEMLVYARRNEEACKTALEKLKS